MSIALANSGDIQVEMIQQHDDQPTAWRDFLASGREGFQHVSSWLTRAEYDAAMARMLAAGTDGDTRRGRPGQWGAIRLPRHRRRAGGIRV